jgi:NADH:ubiquinone oxidoreductase subunit 2 (subunit N)
MVSADVINKINRLNFEDFLWIIFVFLSILNIYGNNFDKEYLKTNNKSYQNNANKVFEFTLIITFLIYSYFFIRNYSAYKECNEEEKQLYVIKVLGSSFLIAGIVCLIYFQSTQRTFIGSPSL